jgi:tetratricopeptide (TPR) repeat protein
VLAPSTVTGYYQPFAMISLMLDYAMGGRENSLMPFHRTSLALHVANTAMIIVLLYLLFGQVWIAAAVGLLFGVHPMTVEPIPWVGERKTLLAAFFALWSLVCYVRYTQKNARGFYFASLAAYFFAVMSKPTSTPLPIVMLLMDYWPLRKLGWRAVLEKVPFFALTGVFAVITYISQSRTAGTGSPAESGAGRILLILCHNIIFYLYKIIWPVNLSSHYPFPEPLALSHPRILAGVIGTCILIPALVISTRWTHAALTGWLIFFVAILPTMQIIGFSNVIASDKYAYLPSLGLLMTLASFLGWLCIRIRRSLTGYAVIITTILILTFAESAATRQYLSLWQDSLTLAQNMLKLAPNSAGVNAHLGFVLNLQGRQAEAVEHLHKAISLDPASAVAYYNLGVALEQQRKPEEAIGYYRQALEVVPKFASADYNIANIFKSRNKFDDAAAYYRLAIQAKPTYVDAHNNLGNILRSQGKFDEAISHFYEALRFKPKSAEIHYNLAITLQRQGKLEEAAMHYRDALRLKPDWPPALNGLASILAAHPNPAIRDANKAIELYKQKKSPPDVSN